MINYHHDDWDKGIINDDYDGENHIADTNANGNVNDSSDNVISITIIRFSDFID